MKHSRNTPASVVVEKSTSVAARIASLIMKPNQFSLVVQQKVEQRNY